RPNLVWNAAQPWCLLLPRIIGPEHPQMALGISTCIPLAAAVFDPYTKDNLGVFSLYFRVVRLDIIHDEIASLRFNTTDLIRMNNQPFEWRVLNGAHHNHTFAER